MAWNPRKYMYATLCHARFEKKGRDKKNKKAAFPLARMKFLLNFQAQKTSQERIIVESFLLSARLQVRQPSLLHDTVQTVISVIHEKVYDKVQREVSKKKLDSLTSVAAVHESQRPKLIEERDEIFSANLVATRKSSDQAAGTIIDNYTGWKKGRAKLSKR